MRFLVCLVVLMLCACEGSGRGEKKLVGNRHAHSVEAHASRKRLLEEKCRDQRLTMPERYRALRELEALDRKRAIFVARSAVEDGMKSASQKEQCLSHNALAVLVRAEDDGYRSASQALDALMESREARTLIRLLRHRKAAQRLEPQ